MKIHRFFPFLAVVLLFLSQIALAGDWPVLSEFKEGRNRFVMEYDVSVREVRFLHYRGRSKKPKYYKTFRVGTDDEVNRAKISVQSYMQSLETPGHKQMGFLQKLNELQYLNMSQCQVIHFHSLSPEGNTNFGKLLSEVERINALERMGPESFRSVPLFDVSLEEEGDFQIRGVLNKSSDIVKLSIVRKDGEIKDYKVEKDGDDYRLVSPKGELLLILKPEMVSESKGKIVLMTSRSHAVQNVHKTYFSLNKKDMDWKVTSFDPNPKSTEALSSVPLLRFNVEHEPVFRINGTEDYFKFLDENELEVLVSNIKVRKNDYDYVSKVSKDEFARCMLDRKMVGVLGTEEEQLVHRKLCLLVSEIETTHGIEKLEAANYLEQIFNSGVILNQAIKTMSDDFRACLGEGGGFDKGRGYLSFDYDYLSKFRTKVRQLLESCRERISSLVVQMSLEEEIRTDSDIADIIPEGATFEHFLKQVVNEGYLKCLSKKEKEHENCKQFASLYKEALIFSADISHRFWQKNERTEANSKKHASLVEGHKSCVDKAQNELLEAEAFDLSSAKTSQIKCASKVLLGLGMDENAYGFEKVIAEIDFFKGREITLSEEQKKIASNKYKECFSEAVKQIGISLEQFDSSIYLCAVEAAREIIPDVYSSILLDEFSDYIWNNEQKVALGKYTSRLAKRRISDLQNVENISKALDKEMPTILAKALDGAVDLVMRGNFSDEDNFVFNSKAQKELSKKLFYLIGGDSNKPVSYELKRFILKEYEKSGLEGARLQTNTFLQNYIKEVIPFIAVKEIGDEIFNKEARNSLAGIVDKEMQACLAEYKPAGEKSFKSIYKFCEKKRFGLKEFLLAKREFETQVSHHFTLSSDAGNTALSPVHYMKECIDGLDKKNFEVGDYEKQVRSCVLLTKIKISNNIDKQRVKKFKPYTRSKDGGAERYSGLTSAYCHNMIFYQITKEIGDNDLSKEVHDKQGENVKSMLTAGNTIYNEKLMDALASSSTLNEEWFDKKLGECRDGTHKFLISGLKNYLIQLIPASMYLSTNRVGQTNKEVLESFLDSELLEQLLKLKIGKGDKGGELNSAEKDPTQKVVTSTLTLGALSNFMKILGSYITDGFIYEKDKMKTELVIFREELKTALKWVNNQERPIRIAELGDFFTESNLADHMAQAMVSELVRKNFMSFLANMEKNELRASRQGSGHSASDIKAKFVKLRAHTKKMTEYYDFSHVIRPKSIQGDRLLNLIKENYLLPKLLGDKVSSYSMEKIHSDVANMILKDSTEGGFAELFVKEVAQLELSKKKSSHWGITRFLFYDSGDFDWASIRKTKAGKRAIDYYGREILLPRMLGKKLSAYEEKLRMKRFKGILDDAISEND